MCRGLLQRQASYRGDPALQGSRHQPPRDRSATLVCARQSPTRKRTTEVIGVLVRGRTTVSAQDRRGVTALL
ncbi:unnamed protein product, partial [Ectocarpus sp. 4 AP-2014]